MQIVLITGKSAQHRYLANRLSRDLPLAAIIVDHGKPTTWANRLKRIWKRYTLRQIAGRACLTLLRHAWGDGARKEARLHSVFGAESAEFCRPDLLQHVRGINTPEGIRTIGALNPDLLLIFGTGIVGNRVLSLARRIALNVHTGLSPCYRGADCAFWPVHNEEPHMLGATVHECTQNVDGGKIFATGHPQLHSDDCLFSVFARCVVTGADLYVRVVKRMMEGEMEGWLQDLSTGREYKAADRGLRAELRARRLIRKGLMRCYVEAARSSAMVGRSSEYLVGRVPAQMAYGAGTERGRDELARQ